MAEPRAHVALLVDFANLRQQLSTDGAEAEVDGRDIARSLVRFAGGVGRVGVARAYADWSREPKLAQSLNGTRLAPVLVPATEDGEDRSHIRLAVDAMETLLNGDEPDAFVLVSSDPSLVPLMQALRSDGSEVIVVATEAAKDDEMRAEADHFVDFQEVVDGLRGDPLVLRPTRERTGTPASAPAAAAAAPAAPARGKRNDDRSGYYAGQPLLTDSDFEDYDWGGFVRLIDELEQRLPFVGVRYLVNKVLGPHNCGIDDPRIKRDLINEAVDEGLIEMYTVGNVNDRTDPVTACRLDRENGLVLDILGPEDELLDEVDAEEDVAETVGATAEDEYSTSAR